MFHRIIIVRNANEFTDSKPKVSDASSLNSLIHAFILQ